MNQHLYAIPDYRAGHYFRHLENFLGTDAINTRLEKIHNELQSESGTYRDYWVRPRVSWWLGFDEARDIIKRSGSFRGALKPSMEYPLQTAIKIYLLFSNMPEYKRSEFRSRILYDDCLEPTLFEIDSAAHFLQLGYDIEWIEDKSLDGKKTPEFIAKRKEVEVEVECKAKQSDSGRRIERRLFYRLVDNLLPVIRESKLAGFVSMVVTSRIPRKNSWHTEARQILKETINVGSKSVCLPDSVVIEYQLYRSTGIEINLSEIDTAFNLKAEPYAHYAIVGTRNKDKVMDPIIFRLTSKKTDAFLDNILASLREAGSQFSGTRASIISCMIPEIYTFGGLESHSALQKMTYYFFDKYAAESINAVSYVSDTVREIDGRVIISNRPSLSFRNHKYQSKYGPEDILLYQ